MDWTKKVFNFVLSLRNIIPFHARKHGSMYNFTYFHISCLHNSNPGLSLYISKHWIRTLHQPPYSQNLYKFSLHKLIITLSIAIYSQGPMLRKWWDARLHISPFCTFDRPVVGGTSSHRSYHQNWKLMMTCIWFLLYFYISFDIIAESID